MLFLPSPQKIYTNEILVYKLRLTFVSLIYPLNLEFIDCSVTSHNCTNSLISSAFPLFFCPYTAHSGFVCVRQACSVNKLMY